MAQKLITSFFAGGDKGTLLNEIIVAKNKKNMYYYTIATFDGHCTIIDLKTDSVFFFTSLVDGIIA